MNYWIHPHIVLSPTASNLKQCLLCSNTLKIKWYAYFCCWKSLLLSGTRHHEYCQKLVTFGFFSIYWQSVQASRKGMVKTLLMFWILTFKLSQKIEWKYNISMEIQLYFKHFLPFDPIPYLLHLPNCYLEGGKSKKERQTNRLNRPNSRISKTTVLLAETEHTSRGTC